MNKDSEDVLKEGTTNKLEKTPRDNIISVMSREDLKSLFNAFSKKANTISQNFYGNSVIKKDDIIELYRKVCEKLRLHQVDACNIFIVVALSNNKFLEFGEITKFVEHSFDEGEIVENIVMKFNFLLNIDKTDMPQHYNMNVRLTGNASPMFLLRHIFSHENSDFDDIENMCPSCTVNIDFFDAIMSDELIQIIKTWYTSRRKVVIEGKLLEWIKKRRDVFTNISSLLCMFIGVVISFILLFRYNFDFLNNLEDYRKITTLLISFLGIIWIFRFLGRKLGFSLEKIIRRIGEIPIFQITKGDISNIDKICQRNSNSLAKLIFHYVIQIILSVLASLAVWLMTR